MLYLIATPIGNLKDITLRALETLKTVDGVICEDTRRTSILLNNYQIKKPLIVLNDYNEAKQIPYLLNLLAQDQNIALVSDAGTPLISDPGYKLVRTCLENNIDIESLPGPSSTITALTLSGLPPDKFTFLGYLPEKDKKRQDLLKALKSMNELISSTYICFVAPHKLIKTINDIFETLGDIDIVLASELTKIHQHVSKKQASEWLNHFSQNHPKGEYTLLFNLK